MQYHVHQYRCAQNPQNIKRRRNVNYSQQNKRRELQDSQQTIKAAGIHGMGNGEQRCNGTSIRRIQFPQLRPDSCTQLLVGRKLANHLLLFRNLRKTVVMQHVVKVLSAHTRRSTVSPFEKSSRLRSSQVFCDTKCSVSLADRYSWYSDISENDCSIKELFGMMHKNNEKIAFYLISLPLSLYYVYFADTNTFHYFTIKIITR